MQSSANAFERFIESAIFASRWLLAPFFIGLIVAMLVLLVKFGKELLSLLLGVFGYVDHDAVISILSRLRRRGEGLRCAAEHGWQGLLARKRVRGAAVA